MQAYGKSQEQVEHLSTCGLQGSTCLGMNMHLAMKEMKEKKGWGSRDNSMEDWQDSVTLSHDTKVVEE